MNDKDGRDVDECKQAKEGWWGKGARLRDAGVRCQRETN